VDADGHQVFVLKNCVAFDVVAVTVSVYDVTDFELCLLDVVNDLLGFRLIILAWVEYHGFFGVVAAGYVAVG
jgi:hypothetical protein